MRRGGQVGMGLTPAMAAKPRTSLTEAKRALVIEAPRNSLGHLVAVGLRWPRGAVVEDIISAAGEVGQAEDMSAAVAAVAEVVDVAGGGRSVSASKKTACPRCGSAPGSDAHRFPYKGAVQTFYSARS